MQIQDEHWSQPEELSNISFTREQLSKAKEHKQSQEYSKHVLKPIFSEHRQAAQRNQYLIVLQ